MHDIKLIRQNPGVFDKAMKLRGFDNLSQKILEIDKKNRGNITDLQKMKEEANVLAKQIGDLMAQGKRDEAAPLLEKSKGIKAKLQEAKEGESDGADSAELIAILETLPNILQENVPVGKDENSNVEIKKVGKKPEFNFTPKQHFEIGEKLEQLDFEQTAKISGSRFASLIGGLAKLERALANFMLDNASAHGFVEASVPALVKENAVYGTAQLPKFEEDLFKTNNGYYLISTSEISLTNLVREKIVTEDDLPIRFTAYTPCFRSEAGSAGRDTRGLIRMHQFNKVEMVSITRPEDSADEHEKMLACAESVLQKLGLHYRVVLLCSGDTGFASSKTYDIEVWLPGQDTYREISSCSNMRDFQARRMNARYTNKATKNNDFLHTLNGSALAVGRTIVAILENYQNADGSVTIPDVLVPYMGGINKIDLPN